ncbi:MAG: ABC transporter permease subunit [Myxococcota bacterium]|nr:ABC transporter permease subunit [Myxococcota bacterium]
MFREIALVALHDFRISIRSRKALVLLLIYLLGSLVTAGFFISGIDFAEQNLADELQVPRGKHTGVMLQELLQTTSFQRTLGFFIGDLDVAQEILHIPVMIILFGWIAYGAVPFITAYLSADSFSKELVTGTARYTLIRISRANWVLGKCLSQSLFMLLGILIAGFSTIAVGAFSLYNFDILSNLYWLFVIGIRVWCYCFSFLGFTLCFSLSIKSINIGRALSLLTVFCSIFLSALLKYDLYREFPLLSATLLPLFPQGHKLILWYPNWILYGPSLLMLLSLGVSAILLGYSVLNRRGT